jgi:hypothetical protein
MNVLAIFEMITDTLNMTPKWFMSEKSAIEI